MGQRKDSPDSKTSQTPEEIEQRFGHVAPGFLVLTIQHRGRGERGHTEARRAGQAGREWGDGGVRHRWFKKQGGIHEAGGQL